MSEATVLPEVPPANLRFRRRLRPVAALGELWRARELVRTLAERELRARYKQAVLGFAWAVVTPLALMIVFSLSVNRFADIETRGSPYPLFVYLGLLTWTFFSTSINQGGQSLVQNIPLLNKVYSPREVFPLASVVVAGLDMAIAAIIGGILFGMWQFMPKATIYWVPLLLLVQLTFTAGVALITSSIVVYLRDLKHALPLLLQIGLFATPVAYGVIDVIPQGLRSVYAAVNPLAAVIDGYRSTVLFGESPEFDLLVPAAVTAVVVLVVGYVLFKKMETGFADVA